MTGKLSDFWLDGHGPDFSKASLWKGRLLTSFTKRELIEIIEFLTEREKERLEQKQHERQTWSRVRPTPTPRR